MGKDKQAKDVLVTIRVTREERTKLLELSLKIGYPNLSEYIRSLIPVETEESRATGQGNG
jgi:hypothetical protein